MFEIEALGMEISTAEAIYLKICDEWWKVRSLLQKFSWTFARSVMYFGVEQSWTDHKIYDVMGPVM